MVSPGLQVWLKEHSPETAAEAAALAEVFVASHKKKTVLELIGKPQNGVKSTVPQYHQRPGTSMSKPPARHTMAPNIPSQPYVK